MRALVREVTSTNVTSKVPGLKRAASAAVPEGRSDATTGGTRVLAKLCEARFRHSPSQGDVACDRGLNKRLWPKVRAVGVRGFTPVKNSRDGRARTDDLFNVTEAL